MERELDRERERLFFRGLGEPDGLLLGEFEREREGAVFNALGDWEGLLFGDFERDRDNCGIFWEVSFKGVDGGLFLSSDFFSIMFLFILSTVFISTTDCFVVSGCWSHGSVFLLSKDVSGVGDRDGDR